MHRPSLHAPCTPPHSPIRPSSLTCSQRAASVQPLAANVKDLLLRSSLVMVFRGSRRRCVPMQLGLAGTDPEATETGTRRQTCLAQMSLLRGCMPSGALSAVFLPCHCPGCDEDQDQSLLTSSAQLGRGHADEGWLPLSKRYYPTDVCLVCRGFWRLVHSALPLQPNTPALSSRGRVMPAPQTYHVYCSTARILRMLHKVLDRPQIRQAAFS